MNDYLNAWERWCERRIGAYRRRYDVPVAPRWLYGRTPVVSLRFWLADFLRYRVADLVLRLVEDYRGRAMSVSPPRGWHRWERWCQRREREYCTEHQVVVGPRWLYARTPVIALRFRLAALVHRLAEAIEGAR